VIAPSRFPLLLLIAPPLFAVLVFALAGTGALSFRPSQREIAELVLDIVVRSVLVSCLLRTTRWSYIATTLYLVILTLYAAVNASLLTDFSAVDEASLGFFVLVNGTTLRHLHRLSVLPTPPTAVARVAKVTQSVGLFLIVGSVWGAIVATFVVLAVFGALLILRPKKQVIK
jgi:hypothetical protein